MRILFKLKNDGKHVISLLNLQKLRHRTTKKKIFFNFRVVNEWINLHEVSVDSSILCNLKSNYDSYIKYKLRSGNYITPVL